MPQVKNNFKKEEEKKFHLDSNKFGFICVGVSNMHVIKKKLDINNMGVVKETSDIILSCPLQTYHHLNTNK